MAIKVCDAIMGSGKSSAAITYMNSNPNKRYIYITPYLEESERIKRACPELRFKEPSNKLPEYEFKKYNHTMELLKNGENITSTHNMFLRYSDEMLDIIKAGNYTLVIDEAVDVLRSSDLKKSDIQLLKDAGWAIENDEGHIEIVPPGEYDGNLAGEIVNLSKGNRIINIELDDSNIRDKSASYYYWIFSKDIFEAFEDVYVLTYLFEAQSMKYYFDLNGMNFTIIGVSYKDGVYSFSDKRDYIPEYTKTLSNKIHIFENKKMNDVGNNKHSLSHTWLTRSSSNASKRIDDLRKNVRNYFINYHKDKPASNKLWATFKTGESFLRGKGYYYNNIAFNAKATNNYKDRDVLAYCVNIFLQPNEKIYLLKNGVEVLEDRYALSVMIQWIWRSAIRDGKEIWIYIPSKRMRNLLINWINEVENLWKAAM